MKKLLLLILLLTSCYDLSIRHKIQQDWNYFEIPEDRISLNGRWDYKSECYYFYDTTYTYVERVNNEEHILTRGFYYVTLNDTILYLLDSNKLEAIRYKISLHNDSMLMYITDSIYLNFVNNNYVRETN